jgi:hypothetical protein
MDLNVQVRWQHVVLIACAMGVLVGGMMIVVAVLPPGGPAKPQPPWWIGVIVLIASILIGLTVLASLRRATARAEELKTLAEGLFELPGGAPEPLVRLNLALRTHFDIAGVQRRDPMPATVGELVRAVAHHADAEARLRPAQLDAARVTLAGLLHRAPESIPWSARVADVVPAGRGRFAFWEDVRTAAPSVPPVLLNPWIENLAIYAFFAALIAIAVPIAQKLDSNPATRMDKPSPGMEVVGHALGLILFGSVIAVLMVPVYVVGRKYASRLPREIATLSDLARHFPAGPVPAPWTPTDVFPHVRDLAAAHLNLSPAALRDNTPLRRAGATH